MVWGPILHEINIKPMDNDLYTYTFEKFFYAQPNVCLEGNESLNNLKVKYNMERLEFLGDSILGIAITDKLFNEFPFATPGSLTRLRSRLVRNETLVKIIKKMKIIENIQMYHPQRTTDNFLLEHSNLKIYADLFESLVGCVFVDRGFEFTKKWIVDIYKKYDIQSGLLMDDNHVDLLQQVTKSQLPAFKSETVDKRTTISCIFNGIKYEHSGLHKPAVKQVVAKKILDDLIRQGTVSRDIFAFKEK